MSGTSPLVGLHLSAKTVGPGLPPNLKVKQVSSSRISANGFHKRHKVFKAHCQCIETMSQVSKLNDESDQSYLKRLAYINGNAWTHLSPDKRKMILHNFMVLLKVKTCWVSYMYGKGYHDYFQRHSFKIGLYICIYLHIVKSKSVFTSLKLMYVIVYPFQ